MPCHCGSNQTFTQCCEPIHRQPELAHKAEQLMRARYSAYVTGNVDFIINTHHLSTRPVNETDQVQAATELAWCKLEIIATRYDKRTATAYVEFKAWYMENGQLQRLHENSRFLQAPLTDSADAQCAWFYVDGTFKD